MLFQSEFFQKVFIYCHLSVNKKESYFSFMLNDKYVSMSELKAELKLTPHGVDYLYAEANDLTWPKNKHNVKITFSNGYELSTPINGSRVSVLEYYYKNEFNVGHIEDDMQRVTKVEFIK